MKKIISFIMLLLIGFILIGCEENDGEKLAELFPQNDIYYSLFVRSFADSDGDGIGDLNGVRENLDYLVDLGITAIWLLPINPSPTYHGYDVTDYKAINPDYGTMADFDNLVKEAEAKGIKIMLDLVINHTSDQHPWFMEAKKGVNNPYRDYYLWTSETKAYETFVGGMVDLNLNNEKVVSEIKEIVDFYLEKGVLGFRLDAAQHFFDNPAETAVTIKNIIFLNDLNSYVKEKAPNSFIVGEVFVSDP